MVGFVFAISDDFIITQDGGIVPFPGSQRGPNKVKTCSPEFGITNARVEVDITNPTLLVRAAIGICIASMTFRRPRISAASRRITRSGPGSRHHIPIVRYMAALSKFTHMGVRVRLFTRNTPTQVRKNMQLRSSVGTQLLGPTFEI